jgi:hypothetical protein
MSLEADSLSHIESIFNTVPGNFLILKPDAPRFTMIAVTDSYLRKTFTKKQDIIGRGIFEVFTDNPDNPEATGLHNLNTSLNYVLAHKKPHRMPNQRYDVYNSETGKFELKVWKPYNKPVLDEKGEVMYIIHSVRDITEFVKLEEAEIRAKEEAEHQRRVLFNLFMQAPIAIAILKGQDYSIELANQPILEIWGRTSEHVMHKPLFVAFPELRGQGYEQILSEVFHCGEQYIAKEHFADMVRSGRRERVYFDFIFQPLCEADGTIHSIIIVAHEITDQVLARRSIEENALELERKVMERTEDLQKVNNDLQVSKNKLEEFAYVASHDLQEPLRKIMTMASFLREMKNEELHDNGRLFIEKIFATAERMKLLINDLFILSKLSYDQEAYEETDLNEILNAVKEDLNLDIAKSNAVIKSDILPKIRVFPTQMLQLFQNLISNSIKYAKKNTPPLIQITHTSIKTDKQPLNGLLPETTYCKLNFSDNGIGFEPEFSEMIFQTFKRLHGKSEYIGTGIGLAICKKIAENHKGIIVAHGIEGEGATFEVYLKC